MATYNYGERSVLRELLSGMLLSFALILAQKHPEQSPGVMENRVMYSVLRNKAATDSRSTYPHNGVRSTFAAIGYIRFHHSPDSLHHIVRV